MIPVLSIRQPWAWLIVNGHKDIENRTWSTNFRGRFLVHAGKTIDAENYDQALQIAAPLGIVLPPTDELPAGGIVGEAVLHDCVTEFVSPWFFGEYGFVLRDQKPLPFVPLRGRLGFFNVDPAVLPAGVVQS